MFPVDITRHVWQDGVMDVKDNRFYRETNEPDHLLHLVLTWADAGQLAKLSDSICRNGDQLPLAAQLAAATLNARGMISQSTNSSGAISRTLMMTELGYDLLAEWDALVAGESEPVQPPVSTPTCLDDLS